ncbi:hypothetical protein [Nocardia lijiangensis]|uniref:hypothetical protein n=1 Tax=Nocardia lijiangensis TaxID=299618 RepID=UPI00082C207B|nr:hypothetical protein [Nocardia lijiangensis]
MTRIVRILIVPSTEWTSIEVPAGGQLVWAEPGGGVVVGGFPGGGVPSGIATYWRTEDFTFGIERCLIRQGSRTNPTSPGEEPSEFEYVESGLQGAIPFMNTDYLLWWKKSMYDAFPPNSGS